MKFSLWTASSLIAVQLLQNGCISIGNSEPQPVQQVRIHGASGRPGITVGDLDQLARNYADRLVVRVSAASDQLKSEKLPEEARVEAHRLKLSVALAAFDIVTSPSGTPGVPDAAQHVLDLAILTELLAIRWVDERGGLKTFGEHGQDLLTEALGPCRESIWGLARLAVHPEQVDQLRSLVHDWRGQNPRAEWITRVRLDEIAAGKQGAEFTRSVVAEFTPLEAALRAVDETRVLGQQAFFYLKRMPLLLDWTMESSVSNVLAAPKAGALVQEVQETLSGVARATTTFERLLESSSQEPAINSTLEAVRESLVEARGLIREAPDLEAVLHKLPPVELGKVATQVGDSAREATVFMRETRALAESSAAAKNMDRVLARTSQALVESSQAAIDHLTTRLLEVFLVVFGAVLVVSLLTAALLRRVRKRREEAAAPPPW